MKEYITYKINLFIKLLCNNNHIKEKYTKQLKSPFRQKIDFPASFLTQQTT